ncbi:hypothetical protein ACJRO7_013739 [Eucalyptus globulus]|uniref:Uncharacterized protein n=1 Tax=Eucalyptus globulus TaxID=34317 RepID=A0ABD3KXT2_EUCGL
MSLPPSPSATPLHLPQSFCLRQLAGRHVFTSSGTGHDGHVPELLLNLKSRQVPVDVIQDDEFDAGTSVMGDRSARQGEGRSWEPVLEQTRRRMALGRRSSCETSDL